jgi:hypothetical protein
MAAVAIDKTIFIVVSWVMLEGAQTPLLHRI